jgi:hypothetical protein
MCHKHPDAPTETVYNPARGAYVRTCPSCVAEAYARKNTRDPETLNHE